jgi:hypothetical protein
MLPLLKTPADPISPDSIRALYNQLTPEEQQLAIAVAQATLHRTTPQEAHPW